MLNHENRAEAPQALPQEELEAKNFGGAEFRARVVMFVSRVSQCCEIKTIRKKMIWNCKITPFNLIYMNLAQNISGELWAEKTIKGKKR